MYTLFLNVLDNSYVIIANHVIPQLAGSSVDGYLNQIATGDIDELTHQSPNAFVINN